MSLEPAPPELAGALAPADRSRPQSGNSRRQREALRRGYRRLLAADCVGRSHRRRHERGSAEHHDERRQQARRQAVRRRQALREQLERLRRRRDRPAERSALLSTNDLALRSVCDDRLVSRRDLVHVLTALWRLSSANPDGVPVAQIDEAIGRGHGDMRTPFNLQSLSDEGLALRLPEGTWALTPPGFAWLKQDRELSDR